MGTYYLIGMNSLVEGMIAVQNSQDEGFGPMPSREHVRRVGWNEVIKKGRELQAS